MITFLLSYKKLWYIERYWKCTLYLIKYEENMIHIVSCVLGRLTNLFTFSVFLLHTGFAGVCNYLLYWCLLVYVALLIILELRQPSSKIYCELPIKMRYYAYFCIYFCTYI
uniref:Uncharacterized protein n=1 Tax=Cacopsylla melanoneura TaxID=428564 RepID=A0A8D8L919_9HEMI